MLRGKFFGGSSLNFFSQILERKKLVGNFISHRFSQMNRSLSANRENPQTPASDDKYHRTFLLILVISFCVIGLLNVSVRLCDFCSSVQFCEKKNARSSLEILSLTDFHR